MKKQEADALRRTTKNRKGNNVQNATPMIPKIRIHVAKKKQVANTSELEDVTDDFIAQQNKLLPDSDSDEEERIRSARIKAYWQSSVQLSPYGFAVRP